MHFNSLIPELTVSNIQKSKEFYVKLGFIIKYEREEDKFCFLELEGNQIMIQEENGHWDTGCLSYPFGRGINLSMSIHDVSKMYENLKKKGITFFRDLMVNSYRANDVLYEDKEFLLQDPDGYLLRFND